MHRQKLIMLLIILIGGTAVVASYVHGFWTHSPESVEAAWGGVTREMRLYYVPSMLLAMLGYFAYTYFLLFRVDPEETRIGGRLGFGVFNVLYAAILVASAMYMPLTFRMVEHPSTALWLLIRLVLAVVGLASLGLIGSLLALRPRRPAWAYWLAVAGTVTFSFQTAVLDALIWPALFPL